MMTRKSSRLVGRVTLVLAFHLVTNAYAETPAGLNPELRSKVDRIGIYYWGGAKAQGVASGVQEIANLNASVARITLSPRMNMDYNREGGCIANFSLAGILADEDVRSALANPRIKVFLLTAYDGTSFADCVTQSFFSPAFYSQANTSKIIDEYGTFVYQLHLLFKESGKAFILSQWEGDNAIYCGSAYNFTQSPEFRQNCLDNYPKAYAGNRTPFDSIDGMVLWYKARYLGASQGSERARSEGLRGVKVFSAPEFCTVHMLRDLEMPSVLWDVIPRIPFDYVSYSSYESLAGAGSALRADLDLIRSVAGTDRVIIGEFGFSRSVSGDRLVALTQFVLNTALTWGVSYIVQWNLYDQVPASDFGLNDVDGNVTELSSFYNRILNPEPLRAID